MNKTELINKISEELNVTKVDAKKFVDTTFSVIYHELVGGNDVAIAGFGKFDIRERAARTGRNPATGEEMEIGPSKAVGFKASKVLKEELNA